MHREGRISNAFTEKAALDDKDDKLNYRALRSIDYDNPAARMKRAFAYAVKFIFERCTNK